MLIITFPKLNATSSNCIFCPNNRLKYSQLNNVYVFGWERVTTKQQKNLRVSRLPFCFLSLCALVCSRPLRCGNEMTNRADVCHNRRSLMLLNKGIPSDNDNADGQIRTDNDRVSDDWVCDAWGVSPPSPTLWPHPPCCMSDSCLFTAAHADGPFPSCDACDAVQRGKRQFFPLIHKGL